MQSLETRRRSEKSNKRSADQPHAEERSIPEAFSRGEIGREVAMTMLSIDYRALLDRMAERELSLHRLPDAQAERMADGMVAFLTATGR